MKAQKVLDELKKLADPDIAEHSQRFFKTGPGEYGEGDQFLGIRVPDTRRIAGKYKKLSLQETEKLLHSKYHEARLCALIILVNKCQKADRELHQTIYDLYLRNTSHVNNWDLVDTSAEKIVGTYLFEYEEEKTVLVKLSESDNLWERRISIMSTFHFIRHGEYSNTLELAQKLLNDEHDLIHKAVGWMLREVGKRDIETEEQFLRKHIHNMPRTMLRYAIEKFPEAKRKKYLAM